MDYLFNSDVEGSSSGSERPECSCRSVYGFDPLEGVYGKIGSEKRMNYDKDIARTEINFLLSCSEEERCEHVQYLLLKKWVAGLMEDRNLKFTPIFYESRDIIDFKKEYCLELVERLRDNPARSTNANLLLMHMNSEALRKLELNMLIESLFMIYPDSEQFKSLVQGQERKLILKNNTLKLMEMRILSTRIMRNDL